MGNLQFDVDEYEPKNMNFDPLPKGRYLAMISSTEVKPTSNGAGMLLKLEFDILEPGFEGRKVFDHLNIKNPSEKAEQIGRGMLSALCRALGKLGIVDDSTELHDLPLIISVKVEPASGEYEAKNKVNGFYPAETSDLKKKKAANITPPVKNKAVPAARKKAIEVAEADDDDIPF